MVTPEAWHIFNEQNILYPGSPNQLFIYPFPKLFPPNICPLQTPGSVKDYLVPVNSLGAKASQ